MLPWQIAWKERIKRREGKKKKKEKSGKRRLISY